MSDNHLTEEERKFFDSIKSLNGNGEGFGVMSQEMKRFKLKSQLEDLRFSADQTMEPPTPIIKIQGQTISTAGNITVFTGQPKTGKSSVFSAIIAGMINLNPHIKIDSLGLDIAENKDQKAVIFIDTEQSKYDWYCHALKTIKRSKAQSPSHFASYHFRGIRVADRLDALEMVLQAESEAHGGIFCILADGLADFAHMGVNADAESSNLIQDIEAMAIQHDCPFITTFHLNPGQDSTKMRGHMGSHLERKSEAVLMLKRTQGENHYTLENYLLRNAGNVPVIEFEYSEDEGWHVFRQFTDLKVKKLDIRTITPKDCLDMLVKCYPSEDDEHSNADLKDAIKRATAIGNNERISELKRYLLREGYLTTNGERERSPKLRYILGMTYYNAKNSDPF